MYFPKTKKNIYIYRYMYVYIYKEIGVQKLHISTYISTYSSSIWSWVNNHQALFKPQGGVSKPSYAHRHIGPSNPYVQKILCLFIYLFRGFFLMGTSISPSVGRCLPLVFFCAKKKKAWSCGCSNIRLNSWKSIKPSPAETFNRTKKNIVIGSPWKPQKNKHMQTSEEQFSPSVLHLLVGSGFFVVLFLRLAPRVCIKILSDSDLTVVFKKPNP